MKTTRRKREPSPPHAPQKAAAPVIALASNCSVKDAAVLKATLQGAEQSVEAVTVDVTAVERIDTASMQLLCAFVRDRHTRNQSVQWRGVSAALDEAVKLLGVNELMHWESAERGGAAS
ncbi:MAG TPA: STAS domain-containing protein [Steroidobacteraceae bacterium]|nr:STAS domain-containing protein [Steroidobacteraceae bacterium]